MYCLVKGDLLGGSVYWHRRVRPAATQRLQKGMPPEQRIFLALHWLQAVKETRYWYEMLSTNSGCKASLDSPRAILLLDISDKCIVVDSACCCCCCCSS